MAIAILVAHGIGPEDAEAEVAGSLGDLILLGGMNPLEWATVNYMVFIHSATGSLAGSPLRR